MLNQLDTLIGFAGVMLLLSLFVTLIVQGIISLLNLRGLSLLWGIVLVVERAEIRTRRQGLIRTIRH